MCGKHGYEEIRLDFYECLRNHPTLMKPRKKPTYSLLHAGFDFIEAQYGKAGIRDLLLNLRNLSTNVFQDAFHLTQDEFDRAFEEYLRQWIASRK